MNDWFSLDLGIGSIGFAPTQAIIKAYKQSVIDGDQSRDIAIFFRQHVDKPMITIYFPPSAGSLAQAFGAQACSKPVRDRRLLVLVGAANSLARYFSDEPTT
jgi:hypothetical protein